MHHLGNRQWRVCYCSASMLIVTVTSLSISIWCCLPPHRKHAVIGTCVHVGTCIFLEGTVAVWDNIIGCMAPAIPLSPDVVDCIFFQKLTNSTNVAYTMRINDLLQIILTYLCTQSSWHENVCLEPSAPLQYKALRRRNTWLLEKEGTKNLSEAFRRLSMLIRDQPFIRLRLWGS